MNNPARSTEVVTKRYDGSSSISWDSKYCAKGVDCVNKVLNVYTKFGTCEGVLVATDRVLTNRHCVEPVISDGQYSGMIAVMAPMRRAIRHGIGTVGMVDKIIFISPKQFQAEGLSPDYALLVLREPLKGIVPAKLNFDGLKNGETYFTYGHSPYGDAKEPLAIEKRTCKAVYNTTFSPNFNSPHFPVVKLADCTIGPGNSGSPLYNEKGELVALIGGQFSPSNTFLLGKLAFHALRNTRSPLTNIGWATNLACMSVIFDSSRPIPTTCDAGFAASLKQSSLPEGLEDKMRESLSAIPIADEKFRYRLARASETGHAIGYITQPLVLRIPECIHPAALETLTADAMLEEEFFYSSAVLSKYWEITSATTSVLKLNSDIAFDRQKLKVSGTSPLEITLQRTPFYRGELKVCY